ncbi:MAG: N-acetylmuramoyl-L-alanine amidase [Clostridia bacterium]|nr:N-acetylmuramoyl-L-alanine amidase [Clostridia bacterium]
MEKKSKKANYSSPLIFCAFTLFLCAFCILLTLANRQNDAQKTDSEVTDNTESASGTFTAVVIDAGHGGEDGGAVSADGAQEKDINLAIALMLRDYYTAAGIPTVLTRDGDVLLYDKNADHVGRKKMMDLASRLATAEGTESSLFISIHQNAFSDKKYNGLQVWYSPHSAQSFDIAKDIQSASTLIQPSNYRKVKAADENLFILHRLHSPAVLVECGFMSNTEEASRLASEEYQRKLAFTIFISTVKYFKIP